jgi:FkbM family methyltransferase
MNLKNFLKYLLRQSGYNIFKPNPYSVFDFESFLYRYLSTNKTLNFIQIGANDGSLLDPLYRFNMNNKSRVKGWVIEPLPDLFEKLTKNYLSIKSIVPVNIAIHNTKEKMTMYRVNPQRKFRKHDFADAIASFDPEFYKKSKLGFEKNDIIEESVNCMSFNSFVKLNKINNIDLIQIDTEGYDAQIIYSIDLDNIKPNIIRFEHGVRDEIMTHKEFNDLCKHLNNFGYQVIAESYDATAYLLKPEDLIF